MGTIAKGEITLSSVNDAYTVSITPASCSIKADFDGSNPQLQVAQGILTVKRGAKAVPFQIVMVGKSSNKLALTYPSAKVASAPFMLTQIDNAQDSGWADFTIATDDGMNYRTTVRFAYSVVRESTMLDWIQDWEGSKTKVGGTYIMTPKLFVGKKEDVVTSDSANTQWIEGALTGVYIGPDLLKSGESSAGIYGYLKDHEIFHINADGGFIGGWTFNEGGLLSKNSVVNILSEGSIFAQNPLSTVPYWGIYADGHAIFANGNVKFMADGSAEFAGKIQSSSGKIGGWTITEHQLYKDRLIIDSERGFIGINAATIQFIDGNTGDLQFPATPEGGIKMWYSSTNNFGMIGWSNSQVVFQLGSTNLMAGWRFNHEAIWTGSASPFLSQGSYTTGTASLTLAPSGLRSSKWYLDANGEASFVGGNVKFESDKAQAFGWLMRADRFSSKHAALISNESYSGLYVSPADLSEIGYGSLLSTIQNNGGIYLYSDGANSVMRAYDTKGNMGFYLSTDGYNKIADWYFDHNSIYIKSANLSDGFTSSEGAMILTSSGIYGFKWKLAADGSGALAGGKIAWTADGKITFDAKVSANNITAGTISTASILCEGKWALNTDGSGYLAAKNISWKPDGSLTISGNIKAITGEIGDWVIDTQKRIASKDGMITLDAKYHQIVLTTDNVNTPSEGMMSGFFGFGSKITLSTSNGTVTTSLANTSYTDYANVTHNAPSTGISYISPQGIFANLAGIKAASVTTGLYHRAAICGLGFANFNKDELEMGREMPAVVGVYGRASNSGTAPAYGGYFFNLKASGLIFNIKYISDSSAATTQLSSSDTLIIGLCNEGETRTVYLPNDGIEGRIVIIKQMGAGVLRVDTSGGQTIYDDTSVNDYYDLDEGYMGIFVFGVWNKGQVTTQVWSANKFIF